MITSQTGLWFRDAKEEFEITSYWKCAILLWDKVNDVVLSHLSRVYHHEP